MRQRLASVLKRPFIGWTLAGTAVLVATIVWLFLGYQSIASWQRDAKLLAQQRADAAADVLVTALRRDMRQVHATVLSAPWRGELMANPTSEIHGIATAFARYPYPEVFFAAADSSAPAGMVFYSRSERTPSWMTGRPESANLPIVVSRAPSIASRLLGRIARDVDRRRGFSSFDIDVGGTQYQAVAVMFYKDGYHDRVDTVFGFLVDLAWVQKNYFRSFVEQIQRLQDPTGALVMDIVDAKGHSLVGVPAASSGAPTSERDFPRLFFDPLLVSLQPPDDLVRESWKVRTTVLNDPAMVTANSGARNTAITGALALAAIGMAFVMALRSGRAQVRLARMRADLAAAVTHELKTPIATVQLITERLATRRDHAPERVRQYAQLALQETKHLKRLIDNLLAYARLTDVTEAYVFESLGVDTIVDESLREFAYVIDERQFDVHIDIPADLTPVRADRTAAHLMLANVIENAIRHSRGEYYLSIRAHRTNGLVTIDVTDRGVGIPETELPMVTRRFFRGQETPPGGSGLGLAIVERIVNDHQGTLAIHSTVGSGTTVSIGLPVAQGHP